MSSLKILSDRELLDKIKHLSLEERKLTTKILEHLREIEARRLFARLGYSSLIEYCMKELNYSEGAAYRRVQAMRLLKELPEVKEKVESGALSLNQLAQAQTFFQKAEKELKESKSIFEKREILNQVSHLSTRKTEEVLSQLEPRISLVPKERVKPMAAGVQLSVQLPAEVFSQLEKLQIFYQGRKSLAEIIALMVAEHSEKLEKKRWPANSSGGTKQSNNMKTVEKINKVAKSKKSKKSANFGAEVLLKPRSRYIPAHLRKLVFSRAGGCCEYISPLSGKKCQSRQFLEFDHRQPFGKGGEHSAGNLRLLCRAHNELHAIESYGFAKVNRFCWKGIKMPR